MSNSGKPHQVSNSAKSHQVSNSAKTDLRVKFNFQNILKYSYIEERSSTLAVNQLQTHLKGGLVSTTDLSEYNQMSNFEN